MSQIQPETQVNGVDTIQDLVGTLPKRITLPHKLEEKQHTLQQAWNSRYVAIVPFCVKCKVPLVLHTHPDGEVLFHCPNCGANWVKGDGWDGPGNDGHEG